MINDKVIRIIRDGVDKGFNVYYIKKLLIEKGYDPIDVQDSVDSYVETIESRKRPHIQHYEAYEKKHESKAHKRIIVHLPYIIIILLAAAVIYMIYAWPANVAQSQQVIQQCKPCEIDTIDETILRQNIDTYGNFSMKVEDQQKSIEAQIKLLEQMNLSLEEKENLIGSQISEIKRLNEFIKEERKQVTTLLLQIINIILQRR